MPNTQQMKFSDVLSSPDRYNSHLHSYKHVYRRGLSQIQCKPPTPNHTSLHIKCTHTPCQALQESPFQE